MNTEVLLWVRGLVILGILALVVYYAGYLFRSIKHGNKPDYEQYRRDALEKSIESGVMGYDESQRTSQLNPAFLRKQSSRNEVQNRHSLSTVQGKGRGEPSTVLPYTIMARYGKHFTGQDIEKLVYHFDLRRSPNHTFELINEDGSVLFTLLNVRKPGVFPLDLREMSSLEGVMLVLQLPAGNDPMKSWQTFNAVAHDMTHAIDGRLCDYQRRPMGEADLRRYRQAAESFADEYLAWLKSQQ